MHPVRVVADLTQLVAGGENGGASRFALDLLAALAPRDAIELQVIVRPDAAREVQPLAQLGARVLITQAAGEIREPRFPLRLARRLPRPLALCLPNIRTLRSLGADVLFSPLQSGAFHEPGLPHVAIAYDLQELSHPEHFDAIERRRRASFRADLARCARVVAISATTRDDLVERARLRFERISVVHPAGPSQRVALDRSTLSDGLAGLGLKPGDFALYPANFWPHKNHVRLLRALATSPCRDDESFRLVLCGALGEKREGIQKLVSSLGLNRLVPLLPYQPDHVMTALLQGARFLIFPSLYEGFGIPVVEAFRLGVPVACSDLPSLRETSGQAALLFDPWSEWSIRNSLVTLWDDPALGNRLRLAGRAEATRYPAGDVAARYEDILVTAGRRPG